MSYSPLLHKNFYEVLQFVLDLLVLHKNFLITYPDMWVIGGGKVLHCLWQRLGKEGMLPYLP